MLKNFVLKNVAAVMAAGGVLALSQIAGPALVSSAPSITKSAYPASVVTKTDLSLDRNRVRPGQKNTAHVTVTADEGTPKGTVTLTVQGRSPRTKVLVNGRASFAMPRDLKAGRTYRVTARYSGKRIWQPSHDTAYVTVKKRGGGQVLGEEGSKNGGSASKNGGSANRGAPTDGGTVAGSEAQGGLPGVGADSTTQLYALGGVGLLAAGAFSLLMYRRRARG